MRLCNDIELRLSKKCYKLTTRKAIRNTRASVLQIREQAIAKIQRENHDNYNRKMANKYRIGELVAIKRAQVTPRSKFCSKFLGPYEITKILRNDWYVVAKVSEHEGPRTTNTSDHIKRWLSSEYMNDKDSNNNYDDDESIYTTSGAMCNQNVGDVGLLYFRILSKFPVNTLGTFT